MLARFDELVNEISANGATPTETKLNEVYQTTLQELALGLKTAFQEDKALKRSGKYKHSYRNYFLAYSKRVTEQLDAVKQGNWTPTVFKPQEIEQELMGSSERKSFASSLVATAA